MPVFRGLRSLVDLERPGLVGLMSFSYGFNEFFSTIIPPLFPFLLPSLEITYSEASLLISVFFTFYVIVQLPVGPLADRYSSRRILTIGMATLAVGMECLVVAPTNPLTLVGMVVAGIGGSTHHPTGVGLISDMESDPTYTRSMGIHGALGSLGTVIAAILVVAVAELLGWRTAIIIGSLAGLAFALILYVTYSRVAPARFVDGSPNFVTALRRTFSEDWNTREVLRALRDALAKSAISVDIVADEFCNTYDDVTAFVDAEAVNVVQIETPDLGEITASIDAVRYCDGTDTRADLGGSCAETDVFARVCAQVALATQPAQLLAKPGMGVDEGYQIVINEMTRAIRQL